MSSTITCGKLATALRSASGQILYGLFEQTYESNVSPKIPSWSCIYFGALEGAMRRIFGCASACEGGMLRNRNGSIKPEGYIESWLKLLRAPHQIIDRKIHLEISTRWNAEIHADHATTVVKIIADSGLATEAATLESGSPLNLQLSEHADLIAQIIKDEHISPWRLISPPYSDAQEPVDASLGYDPAPARSHAVELPVAIRIHQDKILMKDSDGNWRVANSQYAIVQDYVENLWSQELKEPHSFKARIKAFRNALATAPALAAGAQVIVTPAPNEASYQKDQRERFAQHYPVNQEAVGYSTPVTPENIGDLCYLPKDCAVWIPAADQNQMLKASLL